MANSYLKFIKLDYLEKLVINDCWGVEAFFAQLSKPGPCPWRLKTLRWISKQKDDTLNKMKAFEEVLEIIQSLERLHIEVSHTMNLPKATAITKHKDSLESLSINVVEGQTGKIHIYSCADYKQICSQCWKRREIGVAFPQIQATKT